MAWKPRKTPMEPVMARTRKPMENEPPRKIRSVVDGFGRSRLGTSVTGAITVSLPRTLAASRLVMAPFKASYTDAQWCGGERQSNSAPRRRIMAVRSSEPAVHVVGGAPVGRRVEDVLGRAVLDD